MPVERKAVDFGAKLREARERKGVSLREIAAATKISSRVLESLERNDLTRLPGGIFSRSFVRAYAMEVGLDPEAAVEDFVRQFPHDSITDGHPLSSAHIDEGDTIESDRRMASVVLKLVAISVPIAALVLYFGIRGGGAPSVDSAPSSGTALATTDAPRESVGVGRANRLSVELVASRACSISVAVDSQAPIDLQLSAGERRTFDVGTELILRVGDPAAIEWSINGAPARALTSAGGPATVRLTHDNYKDYLAAR